MSAPTTRACARRNARVVDLVLQAEGGPVRGVRALAHGAEALVVRAHVAAAAEVAVLLRSALGALVGGVVALVAFLDRLVLVRAGQADGVQEVDVGAEAVLVGQHFMRVFVDCLGGWVVAAAALGECER